MNFNSPFFKETEKWLQYGTIKAVERFAEFVNNIGEEKPKKENEKKHITKEEIIHELVGDWGVSASYNLGILKDKDSPDEYSK